MAKMPKRTRRAHAKGAEWHGDTLHALQEAKDDGFDDADQNVQWVFEHPARRRKDPTGEARVMHWPDPKRNNFRYYLEPGAKRARPMTKKELRRKLPGGWSLEQVNRWRRGPSPGSARPLSLARHFEEAVKVGITIIPELKSRAFTRKVPAEQVVASAKRYGHPPWFMALWTMWGIRAKAAAIIRAGGEFAIIFGKRKALRKVARLQVKTWKIKPTRIW